MKRNVMFVYLSLMLNLIINHVCQGKHYWSKHYSLTNDLSLYNFLLQRGMTLKNVQISRKGVLLRFQDIRFMIFHFRYKQATI